MWTPSPAVTIPLIIPSTKTWGYAKLHGRVPLCSPLPVPAVRGSQHEPPCLTSNRGPLPLGGPVWGATVGLAGGQPA